MQYTIPISIPVAGFAGCNVFISNENTLSVYFNNLQVRHCRGQIIEDRHYYRCCFKIKGIICKALGGPPTIICTKVILLNLMMTWAKFFRESTN